MLANYLKIALLVFQRRKFFTFVNLFGITFTLAILMVAAAVLDHIFGGQAPEVNQARTLGIYRAALTGEGGASNNGLAGYALLDRHLRDLPGAEKVSISGVFWKTLSYVDGQRVESFLKYTDAEFWEILQFDFIAGRPFSHDEVDQGAFVAVINAATQERFFAGEPAIGKTIEADGTRYRVVGVVENVPMLRFTPFSDIWVPQTTDQGYNQPDQLVGMYFGLIMARSSDDFAMIKQEWAARMAAIDLSGFPHYDSISVVPESAFDNLARMIFSLGSSEQDQSAKLLVWLVIVAVLFMVLPAINLVNLNVSRILERASEIGVRKAFGAPTLTLVGQFIMENVLLTLAGGVLAVVVGYFMLSIIASAGWIPYAQFHLNLRILGLALAATLFFGLFSGVYPAWRMSRLQPVEALRGGGKS